MRSWIAFNPVRQRWLLYRSLRQLEPIGRLTHLLRRLEAEYDAPISPHWLRKNLQYLRAQGYVRRDEYGRWLTTGAAEARHASCRAASDPQ